LLRPKEIDYHRIFIYRTRTAEQDEESPSQTGSAAAEERGRRKSTAVTAGGRKEVNDDLIIIIIHRYGGKTEGQRFLQTRYTFAFYLHPQTSQRLFPK
jgi:hypothetical protein